MIPTLQRHITCRFGHLAQLPYIGWSLSVIPTYSFYRTIAPWPASMQPDARFLALPTCCSPPAGSAACWSAWRSPTGRWNGCVCGGSWGRHRAPSSPRGASRGGWQRGCTCASCSSGIRARSFSCQVVRLVSATCRLVGTVCTVSTLRSQFSQGAKQVISTNCSKPGARLVVPLYSSSCRTLSCNCQYPMLIRFHTFILVAQGVSSAYACCLRLCAPCRWANALAAAAPGSLDRLKVRHNGTLLLGWPARALPPLLSYTGRWIYVFVFGRVCAE